MSNAKYELQRIDVNVSLPILLLNEPSLSYTYFYTKPESFTSSKLSFCYESYNKDAKLHRELPEFLVTEIGTNKDKITFYEGLVLFEKHKDKDKNKDMDKNKDKDVKEFISECLGRLLNINNLNLENADEILFMIQKYQRVHQCLVQTNANIAEIFREVS